MKCITLWQPWATWILLGWKAIETRTHNHFACLKGQRIGIHAGEMFDKNAYYLARNYVDINTQARWKKIPYPSGAIICTAYVRDFGKLSAYNEREALIECSSTRFGLFLIDIQPIEPIIQINGKQGIWEYNIEMDAKTT